MVKAKIKIVLLITVTFGVVLAVKFPKEKKIKLFTSTIKKTKPTNFLEYAGKMYYFGNVLKANFYAALEFCRGEGMQLVSIMNDKENDRLGNFADQIGLHFEEFWTSGTNLASHNRFVWLSTGSAMIYNNWYPGQPSGKSSDGRNITENCVEVARINGSKGLYWNDRYCLDELSFICERYGNEC